MQNGNASMHEKIDEHKFGQMISPHKNLWMQNFNSNDFEPRHSQTISKLEVRKQSKLNVISAHKKISKWGKKLKINRRFECP